MRKYVDGGTERLVDISRRYYQNRRDLCADPRSEQLTDSFEQIPAEEGLFPKAGANRHRINK